MAVLCGAAMAALFAVAVPSGAAHADDGYRFWSYWRSGGTEWKYASTGPGSYKPKDGQVDGWRYAASADKPAHPRAAADFGQICEGVRIRDGYKRVGLVLDYGTASDAPRGSKPPRKKPATSCVVARKDATSTDVLNKAERTRSTDNGLLCAISGYPAQGCGESTSSDKPTKTSSGDAIPSPRDTGSGSASSTWFAVLAGVVIGGVLVAAMVLRRRPWKRQ